MRIQRLLPYVVLLLLSAQQVLAQQTCPDVVTQALDALGENCTNLGLNEACYAYTRVDATFVSAQAEDFFADPADRSPLEVLQSIQTAPFDVEAAQWGVATMNVQANLPGTIPGQAVVFVLIGDVDVANTGVPAEAASTATLSATTAADANLRSGPSTNANVVGRVPAGGEVLADAVSPDGLWLRVLYEEFPAWIALETLADSPDASALPVAAEEDRGAMQSFILRTALNEAACQEAPSLLMVQGPRGVQVDLTVNGADIRIASTVVFAITPDNFLQITVIDGSAVLSDGQIIPAGFTATLALDETGEQASENPDPVRPLTEEELSSFVTLTRIPESVLHYPVVLPLITDIRAAAGQGGSTQANGEECGPFAPRSPIEGLPFNPVTFFWDNAPGATNYRVNLYQAGGLVATFTTEGATTSLTADIGGIPVGVTPYTWEVQALIDGRVVCSVSTAPMFRETPATSPIAPPVSS